MTAALVQEVREEAVEVAKFMGYNVGAVAQQWVADEVPVGGEQKELLHVK